MNDNINWFDL